MSCIVTIGSGRSSNTNAIGATGRIPFCSAQILSYGSEVQAQVPVYTNGIVRNLRVGVVAIGTSTTHDITLRVNGSTGNLNLTVSSTGVFTDTSNSDIIRSGDLVNYFVTRTVGSGTLTLGIISSDFDNEDNINILGSITTVATTWNSGPLPAGNNATGVGELAATNPNHRTFIRGNTVLKNLAVYVNANTLNSGTTYVFPLTADTGITNTALIPSLNVPIPFGQSGLFVNTSDMFMLTVGGRYWIQYWREGSTTGTISFSFFVWNEIIEDSRINYQCGRVLPGLSTNNTVIPIMGSMINGASPETRHRTRIPKDCVLFATNVRLGISANGRSTDSTLTFRVNGADSSIVATILAGSTANVVGTGGPVYLKAGDLVNYMFDVGSGSGTIQLRTINTLLTIDKFDSESNNV